MVAPGNAYITAVNSYNNAAKGKSFESPTLESANDIKQGEFADLVKSAIDEAVRIGERSEYHALARRREARHARVHHVHVVEDQNVARAPAEDDRVAPDRLRTRRVARGRGRAC